MGSVQLRNTFGPINIIRVMRKAAGPICHCNENVALKQPEHIHNVVFQKIHLMYLTYDEDKKIIDISSGKRREKAIRSDNICGSYTKLRSGVVLAARLLCEGLSHPTMSI